MEKAHELGSEPIVSHKVIGRNLLVLLLIWKGGINESSDGWKLEKAEG